MLWDWIGLAKS